MDPFSALNEKKSCRDADRVDNRQRLEGLRAHWMLNIDGFCRTIRGAPPCGGTSMTLTGCAGSSGSYPDKSADGFDVAWRVSIVPERKPNAANAEVHSLLEIDGLQLRKSDSASNQSAVIAAMLCLAVLGWNFGLQTGSAVTTEGQGDAGDVLSACQRASDKSIVRVSGIVY
jgi:hypothetical protein